VGMYCNSGHSDGVKACLSGRLERVVRCYCVLYARINPRRVRWIWLEGMGRIDNKRRSCERMKVGYEAVNGLIVFRSLGRFFTFRSRHRSPLYSPSFLSLPRLTRRSSRLHFIVCSHMGTHVLLIAVGAFSKTKKKQKCEAIR